MNLQIIKAKRSDSSLLLDMMIQFNREEAIEIPIEVMKKTLELSFANANHVQTFLALDYERVIGYMHVCFSFSFEYQGMEASIDEIYILNEYRRLGLAKAAIHEVESVIRSMGVVIFRADVSDDKPWLNDFYNKIGFQQASYRPYYKRL